MTVQLQYYVSFGKGDSSDYIDWEIELTEEEEIAYKKAFRDEIPFDEVPELQEVLARAYAEIEEMEISNGIDMGEEYVLECQGEAEMDPDELNDLVAERDSHALAFFGLTDADEDELDEWDANDLDDLPLIKDFVEGFEPYSPYDEGWTLVVEFAEIDELEDDDFDDDEEEDEIDED